MITEEIANLLIVDINNLFRSGDWCQEAPKYQTWSVLFERNEPHWQELKRSFEQEYAKKYGPLEQKTTAWCYVNFPKVPQDPANKWHTHKNSTISAVMYLTMPQGAEPTHLMLEKEEVLPRTLRVWNFFSSDVLHRTGEWDHEVTDEPRYCIAAAVLK